MKSIMLATALLALACLPVVTFAHTSTTWDCNHESDQVLSYNVKVCLSTGCDPGTFSKIATVPHAGNCPPAAGVTTGPVFPLVAGTAGQMKVTATDINGNESLDSNVVTFDTIPPVAVKGVIVR